jgi:hypothetical protein
MEAGMYDKSNINPTHSSRQVRNALQVISACMFWLKVALGSLKQLPYIIVLGAGLRRV